MYDTRMLATREATAYGKITSNDPRYPPDINVDVPYPG